MSYIKFYAIDEVELGQLPEELMPRWKNIIQLKEQIESLDAAYEKTLKLLFEDAKKLMNLEIDHEREEPEIQIDETGLVIQMFCQCPLCQARAQDLPVGAILEALQAEGELEPEEADEIRKKAAEEQAARETALKLRQIVN